MDVFSGNVSLQNDTSLSNGTESASDTMGISWEYYVPPVIFSLIFVVGVTGNTLVLYVVACFKKMRTVTTCYLVNLAVTDLAFLLWCVPFTAVNYLTTSYVFNEAMCKFVNYMMQVTVQATCLSLALLSLDRYCAILHPISSLAFRRKRVAIIGSIIVWIASFIMASPTAFFYRMKTSSWNGESVKICRPNYPSEAWALGFRIYSMLSIYFIPLLIFFFSGSAIVYRLYNRFQSSTRRSGAQTKKNKRTTCLVFGVVMVFAACWFPNHAINFWFMLNSTKDVSVKMYWIKVRFKVAALILTYVNSACNPFIYAMVGDDFRSCVMSIFFDTKEKQSAIKRTHPKTPKHTTSCPSTERPLAVPTEVCTGDAVCRVEWGNNHCCALWNQGSAMTVCKPLGAPGEQCHLASNRTPYPTENRRRFWRCPCRNGLRCTRSSSDSQVGVCRRT
ncbi:KISS1R [Branchiostoma lanceolatum]|uniref:KISS1R protein n=1 Tax=Branchiostoma lanceolatum TaxID=7740 RepID=A0A8K0EK06_BRALA|nr:KISS1R [Branchiostoma lanceolatum]